MQITDYSRNYLTNELSTRMTTSSVSSNTTEQNTLAASGSKSFDTFTRSNRSETISTTYSPMTVSANTRASSTTELSIRGLIARKAGVPVTSTGEPYINNGSDSMKYNAALKAYEQSANKAAYFADLEVDSDGNAILNSNADKAAYAQALYEYTNALGIMDKIDENFNFTQASYTPSGNMKQPKGACAAFAYAAALSYLTDSTVDPKNLNLYTPAGANYTALSNWSYTDPRTGNKYNTETH
ncbi:MAG: hypothetical protein IJD85_09015, partial [Oscillospiraceae bacterium]|nr:hypothetical protein [Oscillospiraceae bacterium]